MRLRTYAVVAVLLWMGQGCGGQAHSADGGTGWELTVYYTVVEAYHGEPYESIVDCTGASLGRHSSDFLIKVKTEGFGRLTQATAGKGYVAWDFDKHCWQLSGLPLDTRDQALRPWISAAAGPAVALGTRVKVSACGGPIESAACERVKATTWMVEDRFAGAGENRRHLDLYVGEEDRASFETTSPYYFDARGATVRLT